MNKMKFIPTGEIFNNRKEAKQRFGNGGYRKLLSKGLFDFNCSLSNDELQKDNS